MLKPRNIFVLTLAFILCAAVHDTYAQNENDRTLIDPAADPMMRAAGFLEAHPDIRYRLLGLDEYRNNNYADALRFFQRAAYYADKPSQGMVAEMYWSGQGIAQDRAGSRAGLCVDGLGGRAGIPRLHRSARTLLERARLH